MANYLIVISLLLIFPNVYCVLPNYIPAICNLGHVSDRDSLITTYFNLGFTYNEILAFLLLSHGIKLSLSQLKRVLKSRRLRRRKNASRITEVINAVEEELGGSGNSIGYRQMHQRILVDHSLVVARETVRIILKTLDPEGVLLRSRHRFRRRTYSVKGPNYMWHLDGYDKLKPFGFPIHGAIDGYSRRILWLRVTCTNNDPQVISGFYIQCIKQIGEVPRVLRGDNGTENSTVAGIQRFLRRHSTDALSGPESFMYGRSVANQRIEAWWSFLRKSETGWWINFFRDLRDSGQFDENNPLHVDCIRFSFTALLQEELTRVARHWNLHYIRSSRNTESLPGRPDVLFFLPELQDTSDYKITVQTDEVQLVEEMCCSQTTETGCCEEFCELAKLVMEDEGLEYPFTTEEALFLYTRLTTSIGNLL